MIKNNNSEFDFIQTFPPLGHPEHHFNKYPNHPWLKTKDEIKKWLENAAKPTSSYIDYYIINDDLTISGCIENFDVELSFNNIKKLPIQFRSCLGFHIQDNELESLVGTPYIFSILDVSNNKLNSFVGMSKNTSEKSTVLVYGNKINSWEGYGNLNFIGWWQERWCDQTSAKLILEIPEQVKRIRFTKKFGDKMIARLIGDGSNITNNQYSYLVEVEQLRKELIKINEIKELNKEMEDVFLISKKNNKRKL